LEDFDNRYERGKLGGEGQEIVGDALRSINNWMMNNGHTTQLHFIVRNATAATSSGKFFRNGKGICRKPKHVLDSSSDEEPDSSLQALDKALDPAPQFLQSLDHQAQPQAQDPAPQVPQSLEQTQTQAQVPVQVPNEIQGLGLQVENPTQIALVEPQSSESQVETPASVLLVDLVNLYAFTEHELKQKT
jgi:hypothetical protein